MTKNLQQRLLTAAIMGTFIVVSVSVGWYSFIFLLLLINLLAVLEFYRLFSSPTISPLREFGLSLSFGMLISLCLVLNGLINIRILLINIPLAFAIFIKELYSKSVNPFLNLAITFLGIICITIPLCLFIQIAYLPVGTRVYHASSILGIFFILWATDSSAYFFGKRFGKRRLFERISPHKTWEGSIGGACAALVVAYIFSRFDTLFSVSTWITIAVIIAVIGTFGDLVKSMMKRSLNIKDSGTILPGHGGICDRFDSLFGSSPFIFCYLILSGNA